MNTELDMDVLMYVKCKVATDYRSLGKLLTDWQVWLLQRYKFIVEIFSVYFGGPDIICS